MDVNKERDWEKKCASFQKANSSQREAVLETEGPMLLLAGPGTGKTFVLVQRAVYLIGQLGVQPEKIGLITFSEQGAREAGAAIGRELDGLRVPVRLDRMVLGTFAGVCQRLIREHLREAGVDCFCAVLDGFDRQYMLYDALTQKEPAVARKDVDVILAREAGTGAENGSADCTDWEAAGKLCGVLDRVREELQVPEETEKTEKAEKQEAPEKSEEAGKPEETCGEYETALARVLGWYRREMRMRNCLDQVACMELAYRLLRENGEVRREVQAQVRYWMVDEIQELSPLQEQILRLLGEQGNVLAAGDDDQCVSSWKGSGAEVMERFRERFPEGQCKVVRLSENYRSNWGILRMYSRWLNQPGSLWDGHRMEKSVQAASPEPPMYNSVVSIGGGLSEKNPESWKDWRNETLNFVRMLRRSGKIVDLNQIALIFDELNEEAVALGEYLETNGVPVYAPGTKILYQRREVKLAVGMLLHCFPWLRDCALTGRDFAAKTPELGKWYRDCAVLAGEVLHQPGNGNDMLRSWVRENRYQSGLTSMHGLARLAYGLFACEPFRGWLDADLSQGAQAGLAARSLAMLQKDCLSRFDALRGLESGDPHPLSEEAALFFRKFLPCFLENGRRTETDVAEIPSGCVPFLTISQAKCMEFPIAVVCCPVHAVDEGQIGPGQAASSVWLDQWKEGEGAGPQAEQKHLQKMRKVIPTRNKGKTEKAGKTEGAGEAGKSGETRKLEERHRFLRSWYTAYARARNLLVLSLPPGSQQRRWYNDTLAMAASWKEIESNLDRYTFRPVKPAGALPAVSMEELLSLEKCPVRYKMTRELAFPATQTDAEKTVGELVRQTMEEIHREVLEGDHGEITEAEVRRWLEMKASALGRGQRGGEVSSWMLETALQQLMRYVRRRRGSWGKIRRVGLPVRALRPRYILKDSVDLVQESGETLELVLVSPGRGLAAESGAEADAGAGAGAETETGALVLEGRRRQMQICGALTENQLQQSVSRMHLYFPAAEAGSKGGAGSAGGSARGGGEAGGARGVLSVPFDAEEMRNGLLAADTAADQILGRRYTRRAREKDGCACCDFALYCGRASLFMEGRDPVMLHPEPGSAAVRGALAEVREKRNVLLPQQKDKPENRLETLFWKALSRRMVLEWLQQQGQGAGQIRTADCAGVLADSRFPAPYDLAVNGFRVEVSSYAERRGGRRCRELFAWRWSARGNTSPDIRIQAYVLPGSDEAAAFVPVSMQNLEENVPLLLNGTAVCLAGWVSGGDLQEAKERRENRIQLKDTRDIPELLQYLRENRGTQPVCRYCGLVLERYTNRKTGESFLGCPGYRKHPRR